MSDAEDTQFESLLQFLQQQRGFDFSGYKRPSLMRRVHRRMQMLEAKSFEDYRDYLEVHPDEFALLFNTILINITSFFRDLPAWEYLESEVLPDMVKRKASGELVRVWSAGCASGQEVYTIAIVLAEVMGDEQFRERVKIYATDIDEEALTQARRLHPGAAGRSFAAAPGALLRARQRPLRVPRRPAPHGDLRPQRSRAGRADLAPRPPGMPQHADVLQRRGAGQDPQPVPFRAERGRPGQRHSFSAAQRCC